MDRQIKEALRYLGYKNNQVDGPTLDMIRESFEELDRIATPKHVYQIFELEFPNDNEIKISNLHIVSKKLYQNLQGCEKVAVLAVALGTEVDRRLRSYEVKNLARAVVFQACAAAFLETHCDMVQKNIGEKLHNDSLNIRPRFSPGYGDFSITHQKEVLNMLDAQKRIGLTMTESYMLTPTKSVTALIGIYRTQERNYKC